MPADRLVVMLFGLAAIVCVNVWFFPRRARKPSDPSDPS
jgi:hypothetical protein